MFLSVVIHIHVQTQAFFREGDILTLNTHIPKNRPRVSRQGDFRFSTGEVKHSPIRRLYFSSNYLYADHLSMV